MSAINAVNYKELYFENPELTRITGEPSFDSLHTLLNELKANAMSVHSNLGGGAHGHLGLVIPPNAYALVSNTPFDRPVHPGVLNIPANATGHVIKALSTAHKKELRVFHEVRGVERALIQQLVVAIEPQYIVALRNRTTGQFTGTIQQIIQALRTTYGNIAPAALQKLEDDVKTKVFDVVTPIDTIYHKIEDLAEYAELAYAPMTQAQTMNIAYNVINRTGRFDNAIREWNRLPQVQKTWINLKNHFRTAQAELRESGKLTIAEAGFHNANLVDEIVQRVHELNDANQLEEQVCQMVQHQEHANATIADILPSIIAQMQEMQTVLQDLQKDKPNGKKQIKKFVIKKKEGQPNRPLVPATNSYCWTHGRCKHKSADCKFPAEGHKKEATMANKMDGSTFGCV